MSAKHRGRTGPGQPTVTGLWQAAKLCGARTFDPGVPCIYGHTSHRWTNNGICVECKRDRDRRYNAAHKEEHRRRARESVLRRQDEVKAYRRNYYYANREEAIRRAAEWAAANPERTSAAKRRWYDGNRDVARQRNAKWRDNNRDKARASGRKWKKSNVAKVREADARRRAKKVAAQTREDRAAYVSYVMYVRNGRALRCYWCGQRTKKTCRHIDHIIALADGGADIVENLCVACASCNYKKGAKRPFEFAGQAEIEFR